MDELEKLLDIGEGQELGSHCFQPDEIISFASRYDPQRFHLSEEEAAKTHFGRLCASGWHTVALWAKHAFEQDRVLVDRSCRESGRILEFGPARSLRDIRWTIPVFAGDTITFTRKILSCDQANTHAGWHMMKSLCEAFNQNGEQVMIFQHQQLLRYITN